MKQMFVNPVLFFIFLMVFETKVLIYQPKGGLVLPGPLVVNISDIKM